MVFKHFWSCIPSPTLLMAVKTIRSGFRQIDLLRLSGNNADCIERLSGGRHHYLLMIEPKGFEYANEFLAN